MLWPKALGGTSSGPHGQSYSKVFLEALGRKSTLAFCANTALFTRGAGTCHARRKRALRLKAGLRKYCTIDPHLSAAYPILGPNGSTPSARHVPSCSEPAQHRHVRSFVILSDAAAARLLLDAHRARRELRSALRWRQPRRPKRTLAVVEHARSGLAPRAAVRHPRHIEGRDRSALRRWRRLALRLRPSRLHQLRRRGSVALPLRRVVPARHAGRAQPVHL